MRVVRFVLSVLLGVFRRRDGEEVLLFHSPRLHLFPRLHHFLRQHQFPVLLHSRLHQSPKLHHFLKLHHFFKAASFS